MSEEHLLGTEIEDAIEQIETEAGNGIPPTEEEKSHIASGVRQITASKLDFLEGCIDEITKLWDDLPNNCDKPLKLRANKPGVGKFAVILCTAPDSNGLVTAAVERS